MTDARPLNGLYHFAYPCRDAEETRHFYEDILGLPLVNCMMSERVPSTGEEQPYVHFFFEMKNGSYIAFFDLGGMDRPAPSPNTPDWFSISRSRPNRWKMSKRCTNVSPNMASRRRRWSITGSSARSISSIPTGCGWRSRREPSNPAFCKRRQARRTRRSPRGTAASTDELYRPQLGPPPPTVAWTEHSPVGRKLAENMTEAGAHD